MNDLNIRSRIKQLEMYLASTEMTEDCIGDYEVRMIHDELNDLKQKLANYNN